MKGGLVHVDHGERLSGNPLATFGARLQHPDVLLGAHAFIHPLRVYRPDTPIW